MLSQLICYTALNEKWEIEYVSLKGCNYKLFQSSILILLYFFGGIEENHKTLVRTTGFLVDIQSRNLLNTCGWSYDHLVKPRSWSVNLQVQNPTKCSVWHEKKSVSFLNNNVQETCSYPISKHQEFSCNQQKFPRKFSKTKLWHTYVHLPHNNFPSQIAYHPPSCRCSYSQSNTWLH